MGNVPSVESPERGRMAPHRLSKPRTTNVATAGLSSTSRPADLSKRRSLYNRTWSLPYGNASPISPIPPLPDAGDFDQTEPAERPACASRSHSVRNLFRSRSSKGASRRPGRANSVCAMAPSPAPSSRPTRANSMVVVDGGEHYAQTAGWPIPHSGFPFNYDPTSYEAKRLSYLVEQQPNYYEDHSRRSMSENQNLGQTASRRSSLPGPSPTHASSDMSLYTPMRRGSFLLTPGVATRTSPVPPIPHKSTARYSVPSTPSRHDSFDGLEIGMFARHRYSDPQADSIPRVATPCEEEYAQTGAFKLGTLRITNGSPVTSPGSFVEAGFDLASGENHCQDNFQQPEIPELGAEPPKAEESFGCTTPLTAGLLPQICLSPIQLDEVKAVMEELQTTSKNTALEDDLFEIEPPETPQAEVLDVRVDPSAKSLPSQPKLKSEGGCSKEIGRSDSGIVTSPTSEYSQQSLAKADSGYSSNVSLRSFSRPLAAPKKDPCSKIALDTPPDTPYKESPPTQASILQMPISASPDLADSSSSRGPTPPPKDVPNKATDKGQPKESPPRQTVWSLGRTAFSKRVKNSALPGIKPQSQLSPALASEASPRSPASSIVSNSTLSTSSRGSTTRKNGKLHRFLSSSRKSRDAQATSQSKKPEIPVLSQAVEASFTDHIGLLPLPPRRWEIRAEASKETLGTIMSVGSAEYDNSPKSARELAVSSTSKLGNDEHCIATNAALQSAIPAISATRRPIVRKPMSLWNSSAAPRQPLATSPLIAAVSSEPETILPPPNRASTMTCRVKTFTRPSSSSRSSFLTSPIQSPVQRSNTMNAQLEKDISMRYSVSANITSSLASNEMLPVSQEDFVAKRINSPPVSMRTRNNGDFINYPIRAQSTPPTPIRQTPSRRSSREEVQSYPFFDNQGSLSRRSSREAIHSYPPLSEEYRGCNPVSPTRLHLSRRLSVTFYTDSGSYRRPIWEVQPDHHDGVSSGKSSVEQSRQNSFTSQTSHGMPVAPRPSSLQHRYSYDAYSHPQAHAYEDAVLPETEQDLLMRDNGPYPSMPHRDGQEYVTDPWSGRPMPHVLGNHGRYPPFVPRGHYRQQTMGAGQHPVPYRVLHSYNSPAYKNAPIWG